MTSPSSFEQLLARATARWTLTNPTVVAETTGSVIWRAESVDHGPVALKLLKPEADGDEARGGALLVWFAGFGAVKVFDIAPDAVLMAWLEGESLGDLARSGHDEIATNILCNVVERLHARRDTPLPDLTPLRQRFDALFQIAPESWPLGSREVVAKAIGIARTLLDEASPARPLHGDIHHDNIRRSGDDWVAIDPKGLIGDPAYDYANSFQNPEGAETLVLDAARIDRHATQISVLTGISRARLLAWAVAHTALSGAWHIQDGNPVPHQARMLALLVPAYEAG
jgi:streptomycin 6-kinase